MIIVSSTGEGLRLALRGRDAGGLLTVLGVAELPNGRRTQFELPLLTDADAAAIGAWLHAVAAEEADHDRLGLSTPHLALEVVRDDGYDADLRVHLAGPCALTWADEERYGGPLRLLVDHDDLEEAARTWDREVARYARETES